MLDCLVVHVDFSEDDRFLFERALKRAGFAGRYVGCSTVPEARAYLDTEPTAGPVVWVCDPGVAGPQEMQDLVASLRDGAVALGYAGTDRPQARDEMLRAGAREFIVKSLGTEGTQAAALRVIAWCCCRT